MNMQGTKTEKSFTHISAQSFNVLARLSDYSASILKLGIRDKQHWCCGRTISQVTYSGIRQNECSLCSVTARAVPPCQRISVSACMSARRQCPVQGAYLKYTNAFNTNDKNVHLKKKKSMHLLS